MWAGNARASRTSANLDGLILEIRPRASPELGAEVSHLLAIDAASGFPPQDPGGQVHSVDLTIPMPASVKATVRLGGSYCENRAGGLASLTGGQFP